MAATPRKAVSNEWDPMNEEESAIHKHCVEALGPELRGLPEDLIMMLVRGYMSEKDPKGESVAHMIETSDWRKANNIDAALLPENEPAMRKEFETMWRSAIIGEDVDGHLVMVESIGKIPTKEFGALFTGSPEKEANFLSQAALNKEVLRRRNVLKGSQQGKRVYKIIVILDLGGLGMSHLSSSFTGLLKTYISKFSNLYPESLYKLFVINAPFVFSGAWAAISVFVHPITRAKIHIISNPKYCVEELTKLGVKLEFSLEDVYAKAPPLRALVPQLQGATGLPPK